MQFESSTLEGQFSAGLGGSLIWAVNTVCFVVYILVLARIVLSLASMVMPQLVRSNWNHGAGQRHSFEKFVNDFTEPLLRPFKLLIPVGPLALDLSPYVLLLVLDLARTITVSLLS